MVKSSIECYPKFDEPFKIIPFTKEFNDYRTGTRKKEYRARKHVCMDCPIRSSCLGKSAKEKKFSVTYYQAEYQRNIARVDPDSCRDSRQVYERQTAKHGRTCFWNANAVCGIKEDKYHRTKTSQQVYATLRHCLQPQKIPQIHSKPSKKRSRNAQLVF
ncbi:hypothetical protein DSM02_147 [Leeuwenhoekiella polynyae]|uniref:Transposase DDE domain-containing protein n=1 Tax=Leeuwenhoekiella polynyae TaxID=1550906 RepID=A0A4V1KRU7_9FLAO|nr:hypothetical protein DSM02_147 [Leeuwenhoekiella polynyae]